MTWPITTIDTTALDAGTDDPSAARAQIKQMADNMNLIVGTGGSGRLIGVRVFKNTNGLNNSTTYAYSATAGTKFIVIEMMAGGGAGGGANSTNSSYVGTGGGSGSYLVEMRSGSDDLVNAEIIVGGGGSGQSDTSGHGNHGQDSSFARNGGIVKSYCGGGLGGSASAGSVQISGSSSILSASSSEILEILSVQGYISSTAHVISGYYIPGDGCSSTYGTGGCGSRSAFVGNSGSGYGAGGGGGGPYGSSSVSGAGSHGIVIVREYA